MATIPVNFYLTPFADHGAVETLSWTCAAAAAALDVANHIWLVANIQFHAKEPTCTTDTPLDFAGSLRVRDRLMLDVLSSRRPATTLINIFLIERFPGLIAGGAAYLNSDPEAACFVQNFGDATSTGRMMAHELGHLLGLDHVDINYQKEKEAARWVSNLMVPGLSMGTKLSPDQIKLAKKSALLKKFAGG